MAVAINKQAAKRDAMIGGGVILAVFLWSRYHNAFFPQTVATGQTINTGGGLYPQGGTFQTSGGSMPGTNPYPTTPPTLTLPTDTSGTGYIGPAIQGTPTDTGGTGFIDPAVQGTPTDTRRLLGPPIANTNRRLIGPPINSQDTICVALPNGQTTGAGCHYAY